MERITDRWNRCGRWTKTICPRILPVASSGSGATRWNSKVASGIFWDDELSPQMPDLSFPIVCIGTQNGNSCMMTALEVDMICEPSLQPSNTFNCTRNYNISLSWIVRPFGDDSPIKTMIPSEGEQWGRYNLPRTNHFGGIPHGIPHINHQVITRITQITRQPGCPWGLGPRTSGIAMRFREEYQRG